MPLSRSELLELEQLREPLTRLCKKLGSHDVDNSVQQTFCRVLEAQDQYTTGTNLRAWVFLIARNVVKSSFRKLNRETMPGDDVIHRMTETKSGGQHEALELKQAFKIISEMPAAKRDALMAKIEGVDYQVLSDEAGVTLGTTKSRVNRARVDLIRAMDPGAPLSNKSLTKPQSS